jgi:muramoyltetrapeptide carboxypeptidase LdcA involved in peptidoglycan recycling
MVGLKNSDHCDPDDPFVRALAPGRANGLLVGGCLSDLLFTMGTSWEFNLDDAVFVFEEVGSSPHGIDRALLQLTQAGKFERVRGVVIGDLTGAVVRPGHIRRRLKKCWRSVLARSVCR